MREHKLVAGQIVPIRGWELSAAVNQGDAVNHITVLANGSQFTCYVNGTEVFTVTDTEFDSGHIGLSAIVFAAQAQLHVAFDNLTLEAL